MKTIPPIDLTAKKILYVSPFAFAVSGADESLCQILEQANYLKIQPLVVAPIKSPYLKKFKNLGAQTYGFPLLRLKRSLNVFYWIIFLCWQPVEIFYFIFLILINKPALVHLNMESSLSAAVSAHILRKPVIIHYRGKTLDTPAWFFNLFLPLVYLLANRILCISQASGQGFKKRGLSQKVSIFHNAVNLEKFSPGADPTFFKDLTSNPVVTFIGRLDPQKRIADLLVAADLLIKKGLVFDVAIIGGDMNIAEEKIHLQDLKDLLKTLSPKLQVHFLGSQRNIPSILGSSKCLVLPSINEGFGRVIIEALAMKTPVVAAASGALPEILNDGALGTLVEPCWPQGLAEAILKILNGNHEVLIKSELAWQYTKDHYSTRAYAGKLKSVYSAF